MKTNDIKYFTSHKYSGKLKGFLVERQNINSNYWIVEPSHILINNEEIPLNGNEIELLIFHEDGLKNSYDSVSPPVKCTSYNK